MCSYPDQYLHYGTYCLRYADYAKYYVGKYRSFPFKDIPLVQKLSYQLKYVSLWKLELAKENRARHILCSS